MIPSRPLLLVVLFSAVAVGPDFCRAAGSPFELDVKDLDGSGGGKARIRKEEPVRHTKKRSRTEKKAERKDEGVSSYTVKQGDFIFKILVRDYGMSSEDAEAMIPEVQAINKVNVLNLSVGQTLLIPTGKRPRQTARNDSPSKHSSRRHKEPVAQQEPAVQQPVQPVPDRTKLVSLLLPGRMSTPFAVGGRTLDPAEYPVFPAADGGTLVIDGKGALPEEFKASATAADSRLRFVSEDSADQKKFLSAVFQKAGFAEVAEDRTVSLGESAVLSIRADFRIVTQGKEGERQVILLDISPSPAFPSRRLVDYLAGKGLKLVTPSAPEAGTARTAVVAVPEGGNPCERADALVEALKLKESPAAGKGILLRCSESGAVDYTLERLLENEGYRVIRLDQGVDARKVAETVLGKLKLPAMYGKQALGYGKDSGVTAEVEGFLVERDGKRTLVVASPIEPGLKELLEEMELLK